MDAEDVEDTQAGQMHAMRLLGDLDSANMTDKPPPKLPVNRRKPVGWSITDAEVDRIVRSAEARKLAGEAPGAANPPKPPRRTGREKAAR